MEGRGYTEFLEQFTTVSVSVSAIANMRKCDRCSRRGELQGWVQVSIAYSWVVQGSMSIELVFVMHWEP